MRRKLLTKERQLSARVVKLYRGLVSYEQKVRREADLKIAARRERVDKELAEVRSRCTHALKKQEIGRDTCIICAEVWEHD